MQTILTFIGMIFYKFVEFVSRSAHYPVYGLCATLGFSMVSLSYPGYGFVAFSLSALFWAVSAWFAARATGLWWVFATVLFFITLSALALAYYIFPEIREYYPDVVLEKIAEEKK